MNSADMFPLFAQTCTKTSCFVLSQSGFVCVCVCGQGMTHNMEIVLLSQTTRELVLIIGKRIEKC